MKATNIHQHAQTVTRSQREQLNGHKGCVLFFTGYSGSGKSTIANILEEALFKMGAQTYTLDGDNIRAGLNNNLGFSDDDRKENIRRIAEVSKLFADSGAITMTAFIAPFIEDRQIARDIISKDTVFVEVFVKTHLNTCESRDPKGLYKKARAGQIKNFTGIDSEYQPPVNPDITLNTDEYSAETAAYALLHHLYSIDVLSINNISQA